ncbi:MAG: hypothetical protein ABIQ31_05670 [Ferruginibacter sp.]
MTDIIQDYEQPAKRPVFITVLCILTFIGSGWGLVSDTIKYFTADTQAMAISKVKETASGNIQKDTTNDEGAKFAQKMINNLTMTPDNIRKGALSGIGAAVLCLVGAILMWQLKKTGFYLYVAGTLLGIVSPFIIFGGSNVMAIFSSVAVGFIGLVFVILYGVNLKHMR